MIKHITHDRKCIFDCNDTGDEYHYLIKCHVFNHERSQYLHEYYYQRTNMYKFVELLQSKHVQTVRKLSVYVLVINVTSDWFVPVTVDGFLDKMQYLVFKLAAD